MRLENYCMIPEKDLMYLLLEGIPGAIARDGYIFIDNGAPVLAVCHADIVASIAKRVDFAEGYTNRGRHFVTSGALDDRLGIWLVMEIISKRVPLDILITTGEESGASTALEFSLDYASRKQYNWIVEFDRRGTDYVTYGYDNRGFDREMKKSGFTNKGLGSFSDICMMEDFGVMAFNVGIGYHHEHSHNCYADLDDTMDQAARFLRFYRRNADVRYENDALLFMNYEEYEGYRPTNQLDWWQSIGDDSTDQRVRYV